MNREKAENIVTRYLMTGRPLFRAPRLVKRALSIVDRHRESREGRNEPEQYRLALDVYDQLIDKREGFQNRARIRRDLSDYIEQEVLPDHYDFRLDSAAQKLRVARDEGCYGMRPDGTVVTCWDNKSGLSKLDPDEAREESKRLAERYGGHVLELAKKGHGLHYLVMTMPNVEDGNLEEAQNAMYRKFNNFLRIQRDKNKAFPEILGSIAVMESPLAADGKWNVHLNVLMVTQRPYHDGLYERIRREWKFNCYMRPVKGDPVAVAGTFRELLKYAARAVPAKSHDKASRHQSDAPAMTQWPASRFVEWFEAQSGFRRTRTYGCLYGSKVPKPEPRTLDDVTWLGRVSLGPDYFRVAAPLLDGPVILTPGDKSTTNQRATPPTGPP